MPENNTPISTQVPVEPPPPVAAPKRDMTLYLIIGGIVVFLIIIAVGLVVGFSLMTKTSKTSAPPPLPPPPPPENFTTHTNSKFASDSGLLKISSDLKSIRGQIDTMDLFDAQISPPSLDLNINIK